MITIDVLCRSVAGLEAGEVEQWIGNAWLRAEGPPGQYRFEEIDVARVRLIRELRNDLGIDDETLPVVLSLIDQLYATRRQMRKLRQAVEEAAPDEVRQAILSTLAGRGAAEAGEP
jgi:chaperone modulatory protein CbpM